MRLGRVAAASVRWRLRASTSLSLLDTGAGEVTHAGGRRVLEFVAAWDELAPRLSAQGGASASGASLRTLLEALKLAVPALQRAGSDQAGRPRSVRALGVAAILADLGCDGHTVAAALLAEAVDCGVLPLQRVSAALGEPLAALVNDVARVRSLPKSGRAYDDEDAARLRTFCLAFHDVRAILVELAARTDALRHAHALPGWARATLALETMQLYAPMAHAMAATAGQLRFELEDRAFELLFPGSYAAVSGWLAGLLPAGEAALRDAAALLRESLEEDEALRALLGEGGRCEVRMRVKSRYSTMRKLLRDGRQRAAVHDLLGLRVVLHSGSQEGGRQACYRAQELAHALWSPVPGRTKDYVAHPKANGYASLHSTLRLTPAVGGSAQELPLAELQVRTGVMEAHAEAGDAAHTAYKGGVASPDARSLAALIADAAEAVAVERYARFLPAPRAGAGLSPSPNARTALPADELERSVADDAVFRAFDADGDGELSLAELATVVGELGGGEGADSGVALAAAELMRLADTDSSGTVTAAEWAAFRRRMARLQQLPAEDAITQRSLSDSMRLETAERPHAELLAVMPVVKAEPLAPAPVPVPAPAPPSASSALEARAASRQRAMSAVDALTGSGDLTSARELLRGVTGGDPSFSAAWTRWAGLEAQAQQLQTALQLHSAAAMWAVEPSDRARALLRWALCCAGAGQEGDARGLFRRALAAAERAPELGPVPVLHAWATFESRRGGEGRDAARKLLDQALALQPNSVALLLARGVLEAAAGRTLAAARCFAAGARVEPSNARLLQAWGVLEAKRGRLHDARRHFSAALQEHPSNTFVMQAWALAELRAGCPGATRALLTHGVAVDPGSAPLWSAFGQLEEAQGDGGAARRAYAQGLEGSPTNVVLLHAAAKLELAEGRLDAARMLLRRALAAEPHSAAAMKELAAVELAAGNQDAAHAFLQQAQAVGASTGRKGGGRKPRWKLAPETM